MTFHTMRGYEQTLFSPFEFCNVHARSVHTRNSSATFCNVSLTVGRHACGLRCCYRAKAESVLSLLAQLPLMYMQLVQK